VRGWVGTRRQHSPPCAGASVLLDLWTSCCVNCLHVLDELRGLQERWADVLTVVGVHSPKFPHEAEPGAVEATVARFGVTHPVVDDADMTTWQAYAARAWPTLVLIDPEGSSLPGMRARGTPMPSTLFSATLSRGPRPPAP
jgi:thiol-disulfide isomerase/thioredoxin